jgi:P27 family predicted phage terminase small subunit
MGARGPAPTPTAILRLRGSWRAKTRPGEPQAPAGAPKCPRHLNEAQRKVWRQACKALESMGLLTQVDGAALERYVRYLVRWRANEDFLDRNGISFGVKNDDPSNYAAKIGDGTPAAVVDFEEYPQVKDSYKLNEALRQLETQFGLTPAARARLTAPPANDKPKGITASSRSRGATA